MKTNLRGKIREFIQSEEGKVGVKSPLTLGVMTGGLLLAQAIIGTLPASAQSCDPHGDGKECNPDQFGYNTLLGTSRLRNGSSDMRGDLSIKSLCRFRNLCDF